MTGGRSRGDELAAVQTALAQTSIRRATPLASATSIDDKFFVFEIFLLSISPMLIEAHLLDRHRRALTLRHVAASQPLAGQRFRKLLNFGERVGRDGGDAVDGLVGGTHRGR